MPSRTYHILDEIFSSITHGIGFGLSIAALVFLIIKGALLHSPLAVVSYTLYGSSLVLLFLFSTLSHSLSFTGAKRVFQVFDHSAIYLLIAGTYTPYCLLAIKGILGWTLFSIIWICAILGITLKAVFLPRQKKVSKLSTILYVVMGWLVLIAIRPLWLAIDHKGVILLVMGGVAYSIGAYIYSLSFKFSHVVWHLVILLAAILMWLSVYCYV